MDGCSAEMCVPDLGQRLEQWQCKYSWCFLEKAKKFSKTGEFSLEKEGWWCLQTQNVTTYFQGDNPGDQCAWGKQAQGMCFSREKLISVSSDYSYSLMDYW